MGRSANPVVPVSGTAPSTQNPISGIFGGGNVVHITTTGNFVVPAGVTKLRARLWGAGSISGMAGGTTSFGNYVSATGGSSDQTAAGKGIGGDVNRTGGMPGQYGGGGGAASLIGDGGSVGAPTKGGAGAGGTNGNGNSNGVTGNGTNGRPGFTGPGGNNKPFMYGNSASSSAENGMPGLSHILDFIGTGGGGAAPWGGVIGYAGDGANGGGGGSIASTQSTLMFYCGQGGFPGGGHGYYGCGGGFAMKVIDVVPGQQITATIGVPGGTTGSSAGAGLIVVEY